MARRPAGPAVAELAKEKIERGPADWGTAIIAILLIGVAALALHDASGYADPDSSVFPRTVSIALIVFSAAIFVRAVLGFRLRGEAEPGSGLRRGVLITTMLAASLALPFAGFVVTSIALCAVLVVTAVHGRWTWRIAILNGLGCLVLIAVIAWIFRSLLHVPLPTPQIF